MKRKFSLLLALIVVTTSIIKNPMSVKASILTGPVELWTWVNALREADGQDFSIKGFINTAFHTVGLIVPWEHQVPTLEEYMKQQAADEKNINVEDVTDHDVYEYIDNRISNVTNNGCTIADELNIDIKYMANLLESSNPMYTGYSLDLSYYSYTYWWTSDLRQLIDQYKDDYYIFGGATGGNASKWRYYFVDKSKFGAVWRYDLGSGLTARYGIDFYNTKTFDRDAPEGGFFYYERNYNGTIGNAINTTPQVFYSENQYFQAFVNSHRFISSDYTLPLQHNYIFVTYGNNEPITIYGSFQLLANMGLGYSPYYYNNEVYSDFSSSSGDYTVNTDNSNHVTYGDVNTYIDDHHLETGNYPSIPDIEIWIDNQPKPTPLPTPTPTPSPTGNPSGGSGGASSSSATANNEGINININNNHNINFGIPSLSGNTVSGNGSGSSGGGFFDWISDIGGVIGDFIKNVGQLLAEAIRGVAEAIEAVLATIPNLLSALVEFVFGGLPDELKALVTLGITAVIFVSIIKIIRK